ncbi:hypothetical protein K469DRAFT_682909 [Zopfia rhizophila CBS 207.26]|uniref:RRM domain-containing protein n=1 Tax=Zopfia rhizophila CBS 207.26 TaxID=1314779 RepID=A0A6A6EDZ3_9PEZI|nr:hypothetical protein K469DRAFT_682909 [Zopfia rhizophila CBS 207.26]
MAPQTGVNGILPVTVPQKNASAAAPRGPKAVQPRLKLVLRRLPPGLTKSELDTILGDEWKVGGGKVDWMVYKKGKISKDLAKPSRPSRAYFHVTSQTHVAAFGDYVRQASFNDAAKSFQDTALVGPPVLEFASYHRIPGGRRRNDARQGLIDQDQEFKDFLESLTNPVNKPAPAETTAEGQKEEKVTTTPLIEAIREKKANKDKPQAKAASKHGRGESKEEALEKKILSKPGKDTAPIPDKGRRMSKAEKAAKEAVKALNKEAATAKEPAASAPVPPTPERKRGNASIAKSMLQRDLGIVPGPNRRRGTKREVTPVAQDSTPKVEETAAAGKQKAKETLTASEPEKPGKVPTSPKKESSRPSRAERRAFKASLAEKTNKSAAAYGEEPKSNIKGPAPVILKKPQTPAQATQNQPPVTVTVPPTGPASTRASTSVVAQNQGPVQAPTGPSPTQTTPIPSRQAFLKHANASQGITEPLIEEALKMFGAIDKVEIDKRKGFAYVDFAEPEGLQKAIAASPVKVAQGAVQVLERKEKVVRPRPPLPHGPPTGPSRGRGGFAGRGRGRGGGRGGAPVVASAGEVKNSAPNPAAPAPAAEPAT